MKDPIVDELRRIRTVEAEDYKFNLRAYVKDLQEKEAHSPRSIRKHPPPPPHLPVSSKPELSEGVAN